MTARRAFDADVAQAAQQRTDPAGLVIMVDYQRAIRISAALRLTTDGAPATLRLKHPFVVARCKTILLRPSTSALLIGVLPLASRLAQTKWPPDWFQRTGTSPQREQAPRISVPLMPRTRCQRDAAYLLVTLALASYHASLS